MSQINRQWVLARRPHGEAVPEDFLFRELPAEDHELQDGEILVRNVAFLCAPTIRNWMSPPAKGLHPTLALGDPIKGPSAARVLASANPEFPVGSRVCTASNWQDYQVITPGSMLVRPIPDGYSFIDALGALGINSLTAYFGLLEVGQIKPGETLVVSGAAGSVGSAVAQIGKIKHCRVIGIAGGKDKCRWLIDECGIDACIDYKNESVSARISELCPGSIDVFYDNVGGDILQIAVDNMAKFGRVVLCGQIADYNDDGSKPRIGNIMRLVYGGIRVQGFLASMYSAQFPKAMSELAAWIESGDLKHKEDVREGLENLPATLNSLFNGTNSGTLIVKVDEEAAQTR